MTTAAAAIKVPEFKNTFLFWIVLFYIISFFYVGKSTLHIGMGLLAFIYCISWILLYKWISSNNGFTTNFNTVKMAFTAFVSPYIKYLLTFFIIFVMGMSLTFLYGGNKVPNSNDWWISADVFLSIIIALIIFIIQKGGDVGASDAPFYGLCAIFGGTVILNFVNLAKVTNVINKRSILMGTYNMGSGNMSKKSLDSITAFLVLFYLFVVCLMATVFFSISPVASPVMIVVSFLGAIGITIGNHFLTKEITEKVKDEYVPTKNEKARDESQEKIQNQNIFSNSYYSFLQFFKDPSIM